MNMKKLLSLVLAMLLALSALAFAEEAQDDLQARLDAANARVAELEALVELYKQWVADGKKIPVEEVIQLSNCLICKGIDGFRSPAIGWRK